MPADHEAYDSLEVSIDSGLETSESDTKFSYYREPQVTSVEPPLGPVTGGTTVVIRGRGFT